MLRCGKQAARRPEAARKFRKFSETKNLSLRNFTPSNPNRWMFARSANRMART
jgi:hypothetical protein